MIYHAPGCSLYFMVAFSSKMMEQHIRKVHKGRTANSLVSNQERPLIGRPVKTGQQARNVVNATDTALSTINECEKRLEAIPPEKLSKKCDNRSDETEKSRLSAVNKKVCMEKISNTHKALLYIIFMPMKIGI